MPIAKLVFKLPEEKEDFEIANNAYCYKLALEGLDNWLRNMYKYEGKCEVSIEEIRTKIREELDGVEL